MATGHAPQRGPALAGRAGARLALARDRRRRVVATLEGSKSQRPLGAAGGARRGLLEALDARRTFGRPVFAAVLDDAAARFAPRESFDAALGDFLARSALTDAIGAVEALPAYALAWRRLGEALRLLGRDVEADAFATVADRVDASSDASSVLPGEALWSAALDNLKVLGLNGGAVAAA